MEGKYIAGIAAILVAVILVGSVLAPVIDTVSGGAWDETITTTYNEDPDLQFDKQTSNFALDMSVTIGDDVTITNGEDTVTAPYGAMFLLAADNSAVFISVADDLIFTWSDNDGKHSLTLAGDFTAVIADDKLTINDGTAHDAPLPASYLYVPSSTGGYGSFAAGELAKRAEDPVIAAGSFAGAVAYNSSVTLVGDKMIMSADATDTLITSVEWIKTPAAEPAVVPFDPSSITIQPLDPSVLDDPEPDASIMTVPTPDYTDGDWGYTVNSSGMYAGKAKIVSYSGTGGDIVVPDTVGGYEAFVVGNSTNEVIPTDLNVTSLTFNVPWVTNNAFYNCTGINGSIKLADNTTQIGERTFSSCSGLTGTLVTPETLTKIGTNAFYNTGISGLIVLGSNVSNWNYAAFYQTPNLKEVLNLGTAEITTTSFSMNADSVQDYIGADVYIAPATITEVIHHSGGGGGGMGAMYAAIPVVILAAILLAAVSMFVIRRGM